MDADTPTLRQFADVAAVVPGHAAASMGDAPRHVLTLDPAGLSKERYRELLARFRDAIGVRLPAGPYRIHVLDRTAEDLDREGRVAFPWQGGYAGKLAQPWADGAFSSPRHAASGPGCSVTGFPPDYDIRGRLSRPVRGGPVDTGPLDAEAFHWFALMHEVGHCLLGDSEARAETFAALMGLHEERVTRDQISAIARYREADEWTSPLPDDDHFVSAPVWEVVRRAGALRADRGFMAMSVEEVAVLAREIANDHGPTLDEIWDAQAVRRAILSAADRPGFVRWVRSRTDQPALRRLDMVLGNLASGHGPLPRFRLDVPGLRSGMARLAGEGDAFARVILDSLDGPRPKPHIAEDPARGIPLARMAIGIRLRDIPEDAEEPPR